MNLKEDKNYVRIYQEKISTADNIDNILMASSGKIP